MAAGAADEPLGGEGLCEEQEEEEKEETLRGNRRARDEGEEGVLHRGVIVGMRPCGEPQGTG